MIYKTQIGLLNRKESETDMTLEQTNKHTNKRSTEPLSLVRTAADFIGL